MCSVKNATAPNVSVRKSYRLKKASEKLEEQRGNRNVQKKKKVKKTKRRTDQEKKKKKSTTCSSQAASLELLVGLLEGDPSVEHGSAELAPDQVIGQAKDLCSKLGSGVRGEDSGASQTCRGEEQGSWSTRRQTNPDR